MRDINFWRVSVFEFFHDPSFFPQPINLERINPKKDFCKKGSNKDQNRLRNYLMSGEENEEDRLEFDKFHKAY